MSDATAKLMDKDAMKFIDQVGSIYKSVPHLPDSIVEIFAHIAPWGAIIGAILLILAGPLAMIGTLFSLLTLNPLYFAGSLVAFVLYIIEAALLFMAFKPLQARELKGWVFMFWVNVFSVAGSIIRDLTAFNVYGVVVALISALIGFYFVFEMKSKYGPVNEAVTKAKKLAD
jgi:hypothetical protein